MSNIGDVITQEDLLPHLGIDYVDDMVEVNLTRAINTADGYLRESVGDNYPVDHPLTKELALIYASNAYETRGDIKLAGNERKLSDDLAQKLRLYLRRRSDESSI